jgi:hypothetical protein
MEGRFAMKLRVYLLIDHHGAVEVRKRPPEPHLRQVAIHLRIDIDDKWFARPVPTVELTIPDDHIQPLAIVQSEPMDIDQEGGQE